MKKEWQAKNIPVETVLMGAKLLHENKTHEFIDAYIMRKHPGCPVKVAWAAIEKACGNGFIDYGVTDRSGWLTEKGKRKLVTLPSHHEPPPVADQPIPEQPLEP